jgi:hypothetical protein
MGVYELDAEFQISKRRTYHTCSQSLESMQTCSEVRPIKTQNQMAQTHGLGCVDSSHQLPFPNSVTLDHYFHLSNLDAY